MLYTFSKLYLPIPWQRKWAPSTPRVP